jgi:hypothetical protein
LRYALGFTAAVCIGLVTAKAHAAEDGTGFEVGLRLGYGLQLGNMAHSNLTAPKLSDSTTGTIPIIVDVGYRMTPNLGVGIYAQYAFGILSDDYSSACKTRNTDCSVSSVRAGLQASYILPLKHLDAWFGLLLGLERINSSTKAKDGTASQTEALIVTLPEFGVQGGANIKLTTGISVGPFVSLSMGRYSWGNATFSNGQSRHAHIPEAQRTFHEWLIFGVRGNYLL